MKMQVMQKVPGASVLAVQTAAGGRCLKKALLPFLSGFLGGEGMSG